MSFWTPGARIQPATDILANEDAWKREARDAAAR
jgi:hypothetical protein